MRGYFGIGLVRPKTPENVGGVLRGAFCYGAAFVAIEGARHGAVRHGTNTPRTDRHLPVLMPEDVFDVRPFDSEVVVVDLVDGATPLHRFQHPRSALYLFGPEDGTLGRKHIERAQHVVYVPTRGCMNLAATTQVVMYDRCVKRGLFKDEDHKRLVTPVTHA